MTDRPALPAPRIVLRVGITGHRLNKLPASDLDRVRERLAAALEEVDAAVTRFASTPAASGYAPEPPLVRLHSPLAEGADRLAVEAAPPGWTLAALLPMPLDDYQMDFASPGETASPSLASFRSLLARAETVTELPAVGGDHAPVAEGRSAQYDQLGHFLVRHVDVLVAVWDGQPADGPGGTATVVAEASARGVPVIVLRPGQSEITLVSGFMHGDLSQPIATPLDGTALDGILAGLLGLGPGPDGGTEPPSFAREAWPASMRLPVAYTALRWASGAGRWRWPLSYPPLPALLRDAAPFSEAVAGGEPERSSLAEDLGAVLQPRSAWAGALAWAHGQRYRSASVAVFLLAGLSVPLGLLYLFMQDSPAVLTIKAGFVTLELLIVTALVTVVRFATKRGWHRTWIETRELSELLRVSRPLACVGRAADLLPVGRRPATDADAFPLWYARATLRELRPPAGTLESGYLRRLLLATVETDIADQRRYHRANAEAMHAIEHVLRRWGLRCFGATIGVLLLYLGLWAADVALSSGHAHDAQGEGTLHWLLQEIVKPLVSVMAAGLPALGAALTGIHAQGEFGDGSERSRATDRRLGIVEAEIRAVLAAPRATLSLDSAGDLLLRASRLMIHDIPAWRQVPIGKELALPA